VTMWHIQQGTGVRGVPMGVPTGVPGMYRACTGMYRACQTGGIYPGVLREECGTIRERMWHILREGMWHT